MELDILSPPTLESSIEADVQPLDALDLAYENEYGKPMPSNNHSFLQMKIGQLFVKFDEHFDIHSELKLKLVSGNAVPDLCLYPRQPRNWKKDLVFRADAPILVIEILSPRQSFTDITDKIDDVYFPAGVKSAWVVLPAVESVMLFVPGKKVQTFNEGVMNDPASGFSLDLGKLFG